MIVRRSQYHQSVLAAHTNPGNARFRDAVGGLAQQLTNAGVGSQDARHHALARLYAEVQVQASAMAYIDTYWVLGIAAVVMFALSFVLKKNNPRAGRGSVSMH
jgi:DHA2 family multidrug resistance protein